MAITITRTQLEAALRDAQSGRDEAVVRANYWRDRYLQSCEHLQDHHCESTCPEAPEDACPNR